MHAIVVAIVIVQLLHAIVVRLLLFCDVRFAIVVAIVILQLLHAIVVAIVIFQMLHGLLLGGGLTGLYNLAK